MPATSVARRSCLVMSTTGSVLKTGSSTVCTRRLIAPVVVGGKLGRRSPEGSQFLCGNGARVGWQGVAGGRVGERHEAVTVTGMTGAAGE